MHSYDVADCWFFRSLVRLSFSSSGLGGLWTWSLPDTTRIVCIFEPATTVRFLIIVDEVERVGKIERHKPTRLHILSKYSHSTPKNKNISGVATTARAQWRQLTRGKYVKSCNKYISTFRNFQAAAMNKIENIMVWTISSLYSKESADLILFYSNKLSTGQW